MIPTVETARLRLRQFRIEDAGAMFDLMRGEDVLKYFPIGAPLTLDRVTRRIAGQLDHWKERDYGVWAVETLQEETLVGDCGLQFLPNAGHPEIDFLFGCDHWGKGYATEAARAALHWGFEARELPVVAGVVHVDNAASRHVLRKVGMQLLDTTEWFGMPCEYYEIEKRTENE